jgi:hypothetical protein
VALLYLRASAGDPERRRAIRGEFRDHTEKVRTHPPRTHAFHHWTALDTKAFLFAGLVAGGPIAAPEPGDIAARPPQSDPGLLGDPAMPRDATTPLEGRYTDNDSWSTNELDIDWQGVTLYDLYLRGPP